jgi:hypothetical protein
MLQRVLWCREYQRAVEEREAAEALRRQQASDAAAEAQRLAEGGQRSCSFVGRTAYASALVPARMSAAVPFPTGH